MTLKKLHVAVEPAQSAAIPYRVRDGKIEVLLVTSRGKGRWIIPKGDIEADMESHESARQEAFEEAGVVGPVSPVSLGCYRHGRSKKAPVVEVFLMRVERELRSWPEDQERSRRWIPLEEAYEHVHEGGLKLILDEAATIMQQALASPASPAGGLHPAIAALEE